MNDLLVAVAVFALAMAVVLLLDVTVVRRARRLKEIVSQLERARELEPTLAQAIQVNWRARQKPLGSILRRLDAAIGLESTVLRAGLRIGVYQAFVVLGLLSAAGAALGLVFFDDPVASVGCGFAAACLGVAYFKWRGNRRVKTLVRQLPQALDLMKSSLEAGHTFPRALQVVASEFSDPLAGEVRLVLERNRLGEPIQNALEEMAKRVADSEVWFLVVGVILQSEAGGRMAELLGRLADTVRTRQRIQMQLRSLTAQPRLSGWVVGLMPVVVLAAYAIFDPHYVHMLFYDPVGKKLLKAALALDLLALLAIRRTLRLDF